MSGIDFNRLNGPQRKILRETLTRLFKRSSLDMFLQEKGYDPLEDSVAPGPFKYQVFALIGELTRVGHLDDFMAAVREEYPEAPALEDLDVRFGFADDEAESQRVVGGEGRLEKMVREAGFADLNLWTDRLAAAGRRVCRISYQVSGGMVRGTGFLVGKDLVLTNFHVVESVLKGRAEADRVQLSFGYAETAEGLSAGQRYGLAEDWIVAHAPYGEADLAVDAGEPEAGELDFALLRLDTAAGEAAGAAGRRGWFELDDAPAPARDDAIVFVLQHPAGKPLKQSIGIRQASTTPLRLRYDADTDHGSSGGLVLDQRLDPVALHHAGDPSSKIKARYNQGIPLARIRAARAADPAPSGVWRAGARRSGADDRPDGDAPPVDADPAVERDETGGAGRGESRIGSRVQDLLARREPREIERWSSRITRTGTFAEAVAINRLLIELAGPGDREREAAANANLGDLYAGQGRGEDAKRYWARSLALYRRLRDDDRIAELEAKLGR